MGLRVRALVPLPDFSQSLDQSQKNRVQPLMGLGQREVCHPVQVLDGLGEAAPLLQHPQLDARFADPTFGYKKLETHWSAIQ